TERAPVFFAASNRRIRAAERRDESESESESEVESEVESESESEVESESESEPYSSAASSSDGSDPRNGPHSGYRCDGAAIRSAVLQPGRAGRARSSIPHSSGSLKPFFRLQSRHDVTRLSHVLFPPRLLGRT